MTVKDIIVQWLKTRNNSVFYSYDLESAIPIYGRLAHQKVHTASTYSRGFRKLRESNTLRKHGIKLIEITHNESKVKGWKIVKD